MSRAANAGRAAFSINILPQERGGSYNAAFFYLFVAREESKRSLFPSVPFKAAVDKPGRLFASHHQYRVLRTVQGVVHLQQWVKTKWVLIHVLGATPRTYDHCPLRFVRKDDVRRDTAMRQLHQWQATQEAGPKPQEEAAPKPPKREPEQEEGEEEEEEEGEG